MTPAGPFPLFYPLRARRAFSSEQATRRFVTVARLAPKAHVVELGCADATASFFLARELQCSVVAADLDEAVLEELEVKVQAAGLGDRIEVRKLELDALAKLGGPFDGVLVQGRVLLGVEPLARAARALLKKEGRLGFTYPVRVGRTLLARVRQHWEARLGGALHLPRELLQVLEQEGFEPEALESLSDSELDALYREAETHLTGAAGEEHSLREEIALHREQGGKSNVSYAFAVGRRREPGEKPPASPDRG